MTKADLIARIAKRTRCSQALTGKVVNSAFDEITALLTRGGAISFTGFGSFAVAQRAPRKGRNPQTGQEMTITSARVARFRPGKGLRDAVGGRQG